MCRILIEFRMRQDIRGGNKMISTCLTKSNVKLLFTIVEEITTMDLVLEVNIKTYNLKYTKQIII